MARSRWATLAGWALISVLFLSCVLRAQTQSVTHDEAFTYNHFVAHGFVRCWTSFQSNNHTLHSVLVWASTSALRLSPLVLRLPALLGGLLFLVTALRLCRRLFTTGPTFLISLAALTTSPFILDYLVAARGYSLALGFFTAALFIAAIDADARGTPVPATRRGAWRLRGLSCLCALSVASNIGFALVNVALLTTRLIWPRRQTDPRPPGADRWSHVPRTALDLVLPGALLFLALNPAITSFRGEALFFGSPSWSTTLASLVDATFDDFAAPRAWTGGSAWVAGCLALLPGLLLILALVGAVARGEAAPSRPSGRPAGTGGAGPWRLVCWVVLTTVALHSVAHLAFGVPLPEERTGIFLVPMVLLLASLSVRSLDGRGWRAGARRGGLAVLALSVLVFGLSLRWDHFRSWRYDAGAREVYEVVRSLGTTHTGAGIGIDWLFEPSLNFYRTLRGDTHLPRFTRGEPWRHQRCFVLAPDDVPEDRLFIRAEDLQVIYRHPVSRAVVCVRGRDRPPGPVGSR